MQEYRGTVARYLEQLYVNSCRRLVELEPHKIDAMYRRIKDFRNICAHDERLYRVRPYGLNNSFTQLVKDLELVTDRTEYMQYLTQLCQLMPHVCIKFPR